MFFEVGAYAEALARLQLMVSNSGLGVLTGEVGSGKSTLVRRLGQMLVRYIVSQYFVRRPSLIVDKYAFFPCLSSSLFTPY